MSNMYEDMAEASSKLHRKYSNLLGLTHFPDRRLTSITHTILMDVYAYICNDKNEIFTKVEVDVILRDIKHITDILHNNFHEENISKLPPSKAAIIAALITQTISKLGGM